MTLSFSCESPAIDRMSVDISFERQLCAAPHRRGDLRRRVEQQLAAPREREANLVYIQSAISSPLKP